MFKFNSRWGNNKDPKRRELVIELNNLMETTKNQHGEVSYLIAEVMEKEILDGIKDRGWNKTTGSIKVLKEFPYSDHHSFWKNSEGKHMLIMEPYNLNLEWLDIASVYCKKHNLLLYVCGGSSHFYGNTFRIEVTER
jgi:hypothetical protein